MLILEEDPSSSSSSGRRENLRKSDFHYQPRTCGDQSQLLYSSSQSSLLARSPSHDHLMDNVVSLYGASCHATLPATSSGFWLSSSPLKANLPLIMIQMTTIFSICKALNYVLARFGQPRLVSQILTGIILGPLGLGRLDFFSRHMYSTTSMIQLKTLGIIGFGFFLFVSGVKTELNMVWKFGKKSALIGFIGNATAVVLVFFIKFLLKDYIPTDLFTTRIFTSNIFYSWAFTSFVVVTSLVDELKLLNSKVGRLAISSSLIYDMFNMLLSRVLIAIQIASDVNVMFGLYSLLSFFCLITFIFFVVRPTTMWLVKMTPKGELLDESYFAAVLILCLGCGFLSELAGHGIEIGMFAFGMALPSGPSLGITLVEKLEAIMLSVGIPIFVASVGLSLEAVTIKDDSSWGYLIFFLVISFLGKVVGTTALATFYQFPVNEALALALIMASKGLFELRMIDYWKVRQKLRPEYVTVVIVYIAFLVAATTPLIRFLYRPSTRYTSEKRRTIQHAKPHSELRILACVHEEENVAPIVHILDAVQADVSPICIYVLHLVPLSGQAVSMLVLYKRKHHTYSLPKSSNAIMNVFCSLEHQKNNCTVQPYISISPPATMHDEVCNLAIEKKVAFVIVPFHRGAGVDRAFELPNQVARTMNTNLLACAPCSVGILVNTAGGGFSSPFPSDIVVYFLGGPDDREAVSLAIRMTENPRTAVTVVRFLPPEDSLPPDRNNDEGKKMDDIIIEEYLMNYVNDDRVIYRAENVPDVESMVEVIHSMSPNFGLLIVGRREGRECGLTKGMSMWSEYPELGVLGDMLASTNFGTKASILVVQQQANAEGFSPTGQS